MHKEVIAKITLPKNARYLVTGGCGFIGSHLVETLLEMGHVIYVVDNLSTGKLANLPKAANFIEGDVRDEKLMQELLQKVDGCFHLAAVVSLVACHENWLDSTGVNLMGTINVFNAARCGAGRVPVPVVYASSCAVYGDNKNLPLKESLQVKPLSTYGADKLSCELYATAANLVYQVPNTGLRIFNVYGPKQNRDSMYAGVITNFIYNLLSDQALEVFGDGTQTRDFVYVEDVVHFFIRSMELQNKQSHVYNVCTGISVSVNEIASLLMRLMDKKVEIIYSNPRIGDVLHSKGDPNTANEALDLIANYGLQQGLKMLIDSIKQEN